MFIYIYSKFSVISDKIFRKLYLEIHRMNLSVYFIPIPKPRHIKILFANHRFLTKNYL